MTIIYDEIYLKQYNKTFYNYKYDVDDCIVLEFLLSIEVLNANDTKRWNEISANDREFICQIFARLMENDCAALFDEYEDEIREQFREEAENTEYDEGVDGYGCPQTLPDSILRRR